MKNSDKEISFNHRVYKRHINNRIFKKMKTTFDYGPDIDGENALYVTIFMHPRNVFTCSSISKEDVPKLIKFLQSIK